KNKETRRPRTKRIMYTKPFSSAPGRDHRWLSASYSRRVIQAVRIPDTAPIKQTGRITTGWAGDSMMNCQKTSNAGVQSRRASAFRLRRVTGEAFYHAPMRMREVGNIFILKAFCQADCRPLMRADGYHSLCGVPARDLAKMRCAHP